MTDEKIIMDNSPEAATRATATGWLSSKGNFFLDSIGGEEAARYDGCTHRPCNTCGKPAPKVYLRCTECREADKWERVDKFPREAWDGEFPIYSERLGQYINDSDDLEELMEERGLPFDALIPLKCEPNHVRQLDASDYCYEDLPEDADGEAPTEVVKAVEAFNEAVKGVVLSYSPTDIVLVMEQTK